MKTGETHRQHLKAQWLLATLLALGLVVFGLTGCRSETAIVVKVTTEGIEIPDWMDRIQIVVSSDQRSVEKTLVSGELTGEKSSYTATIIRTQGAHRYCAPRPSPSPWSRNSTAACLLVPTASSGAS
mgnify:CR=1 FL=1